VVSSEGGTTGPCVEKTPHCVLDWAGAHGHTGPSSDGIGLAARFGLVSHLASSGGTLYIGDGFAVRAIDIATATVTTLAGALNQSGNVDDLGSAARFGQLTGIATDGIHVWVADVDNLAIRAVTLADGAVTTLGATSAAARGMTYDGTHLYYVTSETSSLYQVDPTTGDTVQVLGFQGAGLLDGAAALAQLDRPRSLFAVGTGQLIVGDTENHRLRGVDLGTGSVTTFAGTLGGYLDGPRATAQFQRLRGVHIGGGSMYIADSDNYVVRRIDLTQNSVTTLAGTANVGGHIEGVGTAAQFDKPMEVHFDSGTGDLFIGEGTVIRRMYGPL
jgi:hypothetical protein